MILFSNFRNDLIVALLILVTPAYVKSISTPNILVDAFEKRECNASTNTTIYKLNQTQLHRIQINCHSEFPNQWTWLKEEFTIPKIIQKERVGRTFVSNLTLDLVNYNHPLDSNFSCAKFSYQKWDKNYMTSCVIIKIVQGEIELHVQSDMTMGNCLNKFSINITLYSENCKSDLKVDLYRSRATCRNGHFGNTTCKDQDTCSSLLSTNQADEFCNIDIVGNITSVENRSIISNIALETVSATPVILYCVPQLFDVFLDWTSFILLYPIAKNNWMDYEYRKNVTYENHSNQTLRLYALRETTKFSNLSQLPTTSKPYKLADGESIRFVCVALKYRYMQGFLFEFGNKNLSLFDTANDTIAWRDKSTEDLHVIQISVPVHPNITNVSCYAPIWNSYQYAKSTLHVSVVAPQLPKVSHVHCNKTSDEVICSCTFSGWPEPSVDWKPNPKYRNSPTRILGTNESDLEGQHPHNRSWQVSDVFKTPQAATVFTCIVQNFAGKDSGSFNYKPSFDALTLTICVILVLVFLLVVLSLLYWRHRKKLLLYAERSQNLTAEEIDEFYKGACPTTTEHEALLLPYNSEYEVSWDKLTLGGTVLGAGQFGLVLKGNIGDVPVAVKTIKRTADVIYFKSLLSELKVLQFVGSHSNIISLIGANTSNIRKREVFLVLDFCSNGCLVTLLRNCRPKFVNFFDSSMEDEKSLPIYENTCSILLTTISLLQFSKEVACALEYLSSKNVIHGDLAARNVLVTEDLHAKICDFGLSKQLFHYTVYVQKVDCPLPLRWMALESLQDMEFSLASDKWSFGIVLWEIFSLGELPYPGEQWSFESYRMLQEGYRMGKPKYANDSIHKIMLALWNEKPQERPKYEYVISQLKKEEEMLT